MPIKTFTRACGFALLAAGLLTILINVIVAPLMFGDHSSAVRESTSLYLLRQSASGVAALLLVFGCLGVHLSQRASVGAFGVVAFIIAFIGSCLLFAVEFADVFVLRAVAESIPGALATLDKNAFMNVGFASAAGLFSLGWVFLPISAWRAKVLPRWAPVTTLAGLLSIPFLQATPLHVTGAILGNCVFGLGLMGMGRGVAKAE